MESDDGSMDSDHTSQSNEYSRIDFEGTENMSTATSNLDMSMIGEDYWFGKQYFRCVLAQDLLRRTSGSGNIQVIDSALETAVQQFDYDGLINTLRAQAIIDFRMSVLSAKLNIFETTMSLVGSVCRRSGRREKATLLRALRMHRGGITSEARHKEEPERLQHEISSKASHSGATALVPDPGFYSSALKEHGDQIGVIPDYEVTTISLVPPHFVAKLSFNGFSYEGHHSTKKGAKHAVSRKACERLHLRNN